MQMSERSTSVPSRPLWYSDRRQKSKSYEELKKKWLTSYAKRREEELLKASVKKATDEAKLRGEEEADKWREKTLWLWEASRLYLKRKKKKLEEWLQKTETLQTLNEEAM